MPPRIWTHPPIQLGTSGGNSIDLANGFCCSGTLGSLVKIGSTEYILKTVKSSPVGSTWAVGTEVHLVNRLAQDVAPGRTVVSLDQFGCLCSTMFRVSPNHLLWILEELVEGRVHNRIVVPDDQKQWTKVALDRMLSIR